MGDIISFITDFIRIDLFVGFGFYSILYFLLKTFMKDQTFLPKFDNRAVQLIIHLGFVWFALWLLGIWIYYLELQNGIEKDDYYNRLTGKYAFAIWAQPIFWFLLTQAYRIKFINKYLIFRVIISLLFVVTFERFVILVTSLHRDYLPSSWTLNSPFEMETGYLIAGLLGKIIVVLTSICLYHFGIERIKKRNRS